MGTVHIPLSTETDTLISADDSVLTERNAVKATLQRDQEWIGILRQIARVVERGVESEKVFDSVEKYSLPELRRHSEALMKARVHLQVHSGLTLSFDHQETQRRRQPPKTAMMQTVDIQTLLCRMKRMC
jgi:hypothetical protein